MTLSKDSILGMIYERSKRSFIHMGIFSFFINVLMLTIPIYMMQLFDRVLVSHSYQTLIFLTLIAFFAILILSVIDIVRAHVAMKLSSWYDEILSTAALLFSPDQVLKGNSYPMMVLRDIQTLKQFIGSNSLFTFFDAPWTPIYLIVIGAISPLLGGVATIGAVLIFLTAWLNERLTRKMQNASSEMATANIYTTTNNLKHAEVIQAMGMLKSLISQWQNQNREMMSLHEKNGQLSGIFLGISKFLRLAFQILILGIGSYLVLDNSITSGMMIASSILMSRALAPVEQAMGVWRQFQQVKLILHRLQEHFNFSGDRNTDLMLPKPKGHLTLENLYLTTSKSENKFIIQNLSLRIKAGEMVAFIGSSAAGKSTLMRLICGVIKPSGGLVRLDEADIYHWNRDDVGHYLGYLPQDIELFLGSVKENIARMGPVDDEAVIEAASLAECHDMILHLPEGYNTIIKPGSPQISGGQRQRIALARALYGNPSLVVLDEPNSNLDGEGEEALARTLQKLKKRGVTVLIVAHRFNVIQFVDTIVVLQQGKIQSAGPRDQILEALQRKAT